jgi:signal transduction histidine kinase
MTATRARRTTPLHFESISRDSQPLEFENNLGQNVVADAGEEPAAAGRREGLPPAFRMRHSRHYVEQLMGDEPLKTVREIAVGDIDAPPAAAGGVESLAASIRAVGVLQPLLVSRVDRRYRLIDGANRLRAAVAAGLRAVPCLVHDVDEASADTLRRAAAERVGMPVPEPPVHARIESHPPTPALAEVIAGFTFASSLLSAMRAAGDDRLRSALLTDLMAIELQRGAAMTLAMSALAQDPSIEGQVDCASLLNAAAVAVAPEARLRSIVLDVTGADAPCRAPVDASMGAAAFTGLLHGILALVTTGGRLAVDLQSTTIRPALILTVTLDGTRIDQESLTRFFDAEWRRHPSGAAGAVMLAAAAHVARAHGGRIEVRAENGTGCTVTLVIPR